MLRQSEEFSDSAAPVLCGIYRLRGDDGAHAHDFAEIAVIAGGHGVHRTAGGAHAVAAGDFFVLRPGAWHGYESCRELVVANCCLALPALRTDLAFLQSLPAIADLLWIAPVARGRYGVHSGQVDAAAAGRFVAGVRQLAATLAAPRRNPIAISGALVSALAHLVGDPGTRHGALEPGRPSAGPPAAVEAVARAVQDDLTRNWALADLAAVARLDPAYLSRLCRQHLGIAPMRYVARLRAERAAVLLARTGLPVARVGAAVGWPEPNHFARRFKSLVGVSPTAYRLRAATGPGTSAH